MGATYRVVGIAGQRATRKGAADGFRIWVRGADDLTRLAGPVPGRGSGSPTSTPNAGPMLPITSIDRAGTSGDARIAIAGTVIAPAALLDATARRIVVQDHKGAVEVLLPTGVGAPPVGARIRAEGRMGIAYGAPRLRADALMVTGAGATPAPLVLHAGPTGSHEWRLVRVKGTITDVQKLGDRWRAEIQVGKARVVVTGQPGAGIARDVMVEGHSVTVAGIVRRPYPTATDQRFTILPRFPADVAVESGPRKPGSTGSAATVEPRSTIAAGEGEIARHIADADMIALADHVGAEVRVGGLVVELRRDGVAIDDGTGIGRIVLRGAAADLLPLLEPDDAINAIGIVETIDGQTMLVVREPGGLLRVNDPTTVGPSRSSDPAGLGGVEARDDRMSRATGLVDLPGAGGSGLAGLAALAAISAASVAVTLVRRRDARGRMAIRIATRLAALMVPAGAPSRQPRAAPGARSEPSVTPGLGVEASVHDPRSAGRA